MVIYMDQKRKSKKRLIQGAFTPILVVGAIFITIFINFILPIKFANFNTNYTRLYK